MMLSTSRRRCLRYLSRHRRCGSHNSEYNSGKGKREDDESSKGPFVIVINDNGECKLESRHSVRGWIITGVYLPIMLSRCRHFRSVKNLSSVNDSLIVDYIARKKVFIARYQRYRTCTRVRNYYYFFLLFS